MKKKAKHQHQTTERKKENWFQKLNEGKKVVDLSQVPQFSGIQNPQSSTIRKSATFQNFVGWTALESDVDTLEGK